MVCVTVCLTVIPSFSDITDVSTIGHGTKTSNCRTPLSHIAQYEDDIIVVELNLDENCSVSSGGVESITLQVARPMTIKTSVSIEAVNAA